MAQRATNSRQKSILADKVLDPVRASQPTGATSASTQLQAAADSSVTVQRLGAIQIAADGHAGTTNDTAPMDFAELSGAVVPVQRKSPQAATTSAATTSTTATPLFVPGAHQIEGVTYSSISSDAYEDWKATTQFAGGMHGAANMGDRIVVAQFKSDSDVTQLFGKNFKAGLLILEGVLTSAAGIAAAVLTGGVATVPGIIAAVAGGIKIIRGLTMLWYGENDQPARALDIMRTLEGALAIIGAGIAGNPALIVFGIVKTLRSALTWISDELQGPAAADGTKAAKTSAQKALNAVAAILHAVEVVALGFAGGAGIATGIVDGDLATGLGGAAVLAVGASKSQRAADQGVDATADLQQPNATATPENAGDLEIATGVEGVINEEDFTNVSVTD